MNDDTTPSPLWRLVIARFRLGPHSGHGPGHWTRVIRNGLDQCRFHPAEASVVRLFALFHDSCRRDESTEPGHGPRRAQLALEFRAAGHFALADPRMALLATACQN